MAGPLRAVRLRYECSLAYVNFFYGRKAVKLFLLLFLLLEGKKLKIPYRYILLQITGNHIL